MILDPCTGTGNFIVNLMRRIPKHQLEKVYRNQLFASEVMLLPYYIASLNIEHEYSELMGTYEPFEGLCFVDTLDLAESQQKSFAFMTEKNTERVERQKQAAITVILGNPPYNVGQLNENDNNKNRAYEVVDKRVADTYAKDSKATLNRALYDPYVKFFRWATDRLQGKNGIVCFVSNNSFVDGVAFDGMRKHLLKDFDHIYHLNLKGNARTSSERRRKEGGNIFSDEIRVGVGITLLIRDDRKSSRLMYYAVPDYWKAEQKKKYLSSFDTLSKVAWQNLTPSGKNDWLLPENEEEFEDFISIGSKETKSAKVQNAQAIFKIYGRGVATNSDDYMFDFNGNSLCQRAMNMVENFNTQLDRWKRKGQPKEIDVFLQVDETILKWIRNTKRTLLRGEYVDFTETKIRKGIYRPFSKKYYYFEKAFNEDVYWFPKIFPTTETENENKVICVVNEAQIPFSAQITNCIPALHYGGRQTQCFPFYVYDESPTNNQQLTTTNQQRFTRRENITDWALTQFRTHYSDNTISKWDIFYYVYGLLHHPGYRERYADNLKRELPRIPFAPDFWAFSRPGISPGMGRK